MGADLFGSYVATILATMVLGREVVATGDNFGGLSPILLPMVIAGLGIVFSLVGILLIRVRDDGGVKEVQSALNVGNWVSVLLTAAVSYFVIRWMLPAGEMTLGRPESEGFTSLDVFWAVVIGLVVGALMSLITEYYTAMGRRPVL